MGLLRFVLAVSVIAGHAETKAFGLDWVDMFYAVQAFFAISGFYMAMVLNETYRELPLRAFYRARALRIYPSYLVGLAGMVLVNRGEIKAILLSLTPLAKVWVLGQNAVIFGQDVNYLLCLPDKAGACMPPIPLTFNPPAWSLSVELGFYLVAPFIVRDPRRILAFIAVGAAYVLSTYALKLPIDDIRPFGAVDVYPLRYYFYPSSFIFFGAGALAYHLRRMTIGATYALLVPAVVVFATIRTDMPPWHLLVFALAIPELFRLTKSNPVDRAVGELSYPLYILHWPVLTFVKRHFAGGWILRHATIGTVTVSITAVLATLLYFAVDRPIGALRHPKPSQPDVATREPLAGRIFCVLYLAFPFAIVAALVR